MGDSMFCDTFGTAIAPREPMAMYRTDVMADEVIITFETLTSGDFSYNHAGMAVTSVKSNKMTPYKVYQLSPHQDIASKSIPTVIKNMMNWIPTATVTTKQNICHAVFSCFKNKPTIQQQYDKIM